MIYFNNQTKTGLPIQKIRLLTKKAGKILRIKNKEISISFCGDKLIHKLNKQFRHKDKPTDVLSFALEDKKILGDIIISLDTARKNSKYFGTSLLEELMFLIVHGICHLLGHDHQTQAEERQMQNLEKRVLYNLFNKQFYV